MKLAMCLSLFMASLLASCTVGVVDQDVRIGADAAPSGNNPGGNNPGGGSTTPDAPPANIACEMISAQRPSGRHNVGASCMASGCHGTNNPRATVFTAAGTAYTTKDGGTAAAGATIIIGNKKLIVANNGNFYTSDPITYPTETSASLCPDTTPMITKLNGAGDGDCNSCHNGSTTAKIYVK